MNYSSNCNALAASRIHMQMRTVHLVINICPKFQKVQKCSDLQIQELQGNLRHQEQLMEGLLFRLQAMAHS